MLTLPAHNASEWTGPSGNNTYLLPGRVSTLIDAGVGHASHIAAIAGALGAAPLRLILITHSHPDHSAGVPALLERWPGARVLHGSDFAGLGEIDAGSSRLRILPTPGHAPDHVSFMDVLSRDLYCGDLVRAGGTIVIPASQGGSLRQYLASLRLVRDLEPRRLLPGHGPAVDDPAAAINGYLRHRQEREDQIVATLATGPSTPAEIVARVYGALSPAIARAAAESVLAHLVKLQEDGRAAVTGEIWRLVGSIGEM